MPKWIEYGFRGISAYLAGLRKGADKRPDWDIKWFCQPKAILTIYGVLRLCRKARNSPIVGRGP